MGNSRLQYSSDYQYEVAEDVEDDGDDYQPPSTPKRKKAVAPKSKAPKTPKNPSPKKAKAVTKLDDKPFPLFDLPGELYVFFSLAPFVRNLALSFPASVVLVSICSSAHNVPTTY